MTSLLEFLKADLIRICPGGQDDVLVNVFKSQSELFWWILTSLLVFLRVNLNCFGG